MDLSEELEIQGPAVMGRGVEKLNNGQILMVGGATYYGSPNSYSDYVQIFNPKFNSYTPISPLPSARYNGEVRMLPSGNILIFGGFDGEKYLDETLIFNLDSHSYTIQETMPFPVQSHSSVSLHDGSIISFGGSNASGIVGRVAKFEKSSWSELSPMPLALQYTASLVMDNGNVLIIGGKGVAHSLKTMLYSSSMDAYELVADAPIAMRGAILELLDDGRVFYGFGENHLGEGGGLCLLS